MDTQLRLRNGCVPPTTQKRFTSLAAERREVMKGGRRKGGDDASNTSLNTFPRTVKLPYCTSGSFSSTVSNHSARLHHTDRPESTQQGKLAVWLALGWSPDPGVVARHTHTQSVLPLLPPIFYHVLFKCPFPYLLLSISLSSSPSSLSLYSLVLCLFPAISPQNSSPFSH